MVKGEVKVEQLMYVSIINLRGPSKTHKNKLGIHVIKIPYQTQDTEQNTTQEKQSVENNTILLKQTIEHPYPVKQSVEQLWLFHRRLCSRRNISIKI